MITLTALLPSTAFSLAYALPLLLLSLLVTFAGTFLTLDRTRSFPKSQGYAAIPAPGGFDLSTKKRTRFVWQLQGGIGGLAGGYLFGLHFVTALALIIPSTTQSAPLSSKSFLAVWVLTCVLTTWLAGRYRYAALGFFAISGGTLFALALCVIIHPSLPSRVILTAVFMPLFTALVALSAFIPRISLTFLHPLLRLCTTSTGAFGVIVAVSLLSNPRITQWANVWERLWVRDGNDGWGSGKEQGLSAAWGVLVVVGALSDWALRRWVGECPDEKWDNYLKHYAANLPNSADRAGTFEPLGSFWDRWFPSQASRDPPFVPPPKLGSAKADMSKDIVFPDDAKVVGLDLLKKKVTKKRRRAFGKTDVDGERRGRRKPVKFGVVDSSSDEELSDEDKVKAPTFPSGTHSSSAPTLVDGEAGEKDIVKDKETRDPLDIDYDAEIARLKHVRNSDSGPGAFDVGEEYSDYERERENTRERERRGAGWVPGFMRQHASSVVARGDQEEDEDGGMELLRPPPLSQATGTRMGKGMVSVPATPSLIRAFDRIRVAQEEAYGVHGNVVPVPQAGVGGGDRRLREGNMEDESGDGRWDGFWRDVRSQAGVHTS